MKNIYFAFSLVFLVLLAFLACSPAGGDDEGDGTGTSSGGLGKKSSSSKGGSAPNSKSGACYITFTLVEDYLDVCLEGITKSITRDECDEFAEDLNYEPGVPGDAFIASFDKNKSCPSGEDYKCHLGKTGDEGYAYLYGSYYDEYSCEDFGGTLVSTPSSSSKKASSSSNGGSKQSSSSKGGSSQAGVCYLSFTGSLAGNHVCEEGVSQPMTKEDCEMIGEILAEYATYKFQTSCPSGELLRCVEDPLRAYYYGPRFTDETCSSLGVEDDPSAPKKSSSSGGIKSSSSAGNSTSGVCYYEMYEDWAVCIKPMTNSECKSLSKYAEFQTSCPPRPIVSCPPSSGKTAYFYGDDAEPDDCDYFEY
ncbi:MAG: hypothetical protein FWF63_08225 [Fibromonadales bacterium]|nr:hypothetical protein [Fibromonadales bacterium]